MISIKIDKKTYNNLSQKIIDFNLNLWYERLVNITKRKYSYTEAWKNIHSILSFFGESFNDNQLKKTIIKSWQNKGWYEIRYKNWHFAVTIQLGLFGNNIAIVQDCIHDKDYHNDTMQTSPFEMDSPDDKSHLVDWREYKFDRLISESIKNSINKIINSRNKR